VAPQATKPRQFQSDSNQSNTGFESWQRSIKYNIIYII
jgi:predicted phage tail protein